MSQNGSTRRERNRSDAEPADNSFKMLNLRYAWGKVLPEWAGMCRLDPKAHPMEESAKALINQVVRRAGVPMVSGTDK